MLKAVTEAAHGRLEKRGELVAFYIDFEGDRLTGDSDDGVYAPGRDIDRDRILVAFADSRPNIMARRTQYKRYVTI